MNRELLISLFKLKMEAIAMATECLPDPLKNKANECRQEFMRIVHEVTGEYLAEEQVKAAKGTGLKKVEIE